MVFFIATVERSSTFKITIKVKVKVNLSLYIAWMHRDGKEL